MNYGRDPKLLTTVFWINKGNISEEALQNGILHILQNFEIVLCSVFATVLIFFCYNYFSEMVYLGKSIGYIIT